jgi:hypothetical protein
LVIVGKRAKLLTSIEPYVTYIRKGLMPQNVETIYVLGRPESRAKLDEICARLSDKYECVRKLHFNRFLKYSDRREVALTYLAVLRLKGVSIVRPSA